MDAGPEEQEAARIRALLREIEGQRARGELAFAAAPLRLYGVSGGRFVRVLDEHQEAISPRSARTRDAAEPAVGSNKDADSTGAGSATEACLSRDQDDGSANTDRPGQEEYRESNEDVEMASASADEGDEELDSAARSMEDAPSTTRKDDAKTGATTDTVSEVNPPTDEQEDREAAAGKEAVPRQIATPHELHLRHEHVGEWLQGEHKTSEQPQPPPMGTRGNSASAIPESLTQNVKDSIDHQKLWAGWPAHLEERRRIWFEAQSLPAAGGHVRPLVYWLQNCFRVAQSNFALEAAIMLAQRLGVPLALVTLVRSSVIYPVRHAQTANDAYLRWSLLEMQDQCARANVPFYGITADEAGSAPKSSTGHSDSREWQRHPLVSVLDAFHPHVVVTDATFDVFSAGDMLRIAQHLQLSRSVSSWSLIAIDSSSYVPVHNVSLRARGSLERKASFLSEEEFGHEFTAALAQHGGDVGGAAVYLQLLTSASVAAVTSLDSSLPDALQALGLELIDWAVVRGMAAESSAQLPTLTERAGLKTLNTLLAKVDHRPAIQAELQGGGVLSLLPFVRQGSLFSGYIIQRISEAIDFFPAPVTPQDRKALATLKVMRSRAMSYLAKERDYALYLALWCASQHEAAENDSQPVSYAHLAASSALIDSLSFSSLISASLDAYARLLPSWVDNNVSLAHLPCGAAVATTPEAAGSSYDPYELESARTQDAYWNAIQRFFVRHQYLHPLLAVYWAYRVMQWAVSARAGVAMIDALVSKCAAGCAHSPDTVFMIWNALFLRLERPKADGSSSPDVLADPRAFQRAFELELASQPKLQLP